MHLMFGCWLCMATQLKSMVRMGKPVLSVVSVMFEPFLGRSVVRHCMSFGLCVHRVIIYIGPGDIIIKHAICKQLGILCQARCGQQQRPPA